MPQSNPQNNISQPKTTENKKLKANIQRFNILYIINILRLYSSKEHPMSILEIMEKLDSTYDPEYISDSSTKQTNGSLINRTTIHRQLESFICCSEFLNNMNTSDFFTPDTQEKNLSMNFKIHVMKKLPTANAMFEDVTEAFIDDYYTRQDQKEEASKNNTQSTKKTKSPMLYYYYESCVSTDELNELIHMIETYPNYTVEDVVARIKKLRNLAPGYFYNENQSIPSLNYKNRLQQNPKYVSSKYQYRKENETDKSLKNHLQWNLHLLYQYIHNQEDIKIVYGYYNEQKQLVPRTGYDQGPHRITPYHIICSNSQYYLVAYNPYRDTDDDNGIMQYRIDRIIEIHPINDSDKPGNIGPEHRMIPFHNALDYSKIHPFMMAGRTGSVSFLCKKSSITVNKLIDFFGYDRFQITNPDPKLFDKLLKNHENISHWINVHCDEVAYDSVRIWAKQYCSDCVVYQPDSLRKKIREEIETAARFYE